MTRAFLFPGQGSKVADIQEFCDTYSVCAALKTQSQYYNSSYQMDLVTSEMIIAEALKLNNINPTYAAGLSLGAFTALASLNIIPDASELYYMIQYRNDYMSKYNDPDGCMLAIIDYPLKELKNICHKISKKNRNVLSIANINSPNQIVISGNSKSIYEAKAFFDSNSILSMPLDVPYACHTSLMNTANKYYLENVNTELLEYKYGYISNVTGTMPKSIKELKSDFFKHMISPVLWEKSMRTLIDKGVDEFIQVGPGHTLASFLKNIKPDVNVHCVSTLKDIQKLL